MRSLEISFLDRKEGALGLNTRHQKPRELTGVRYLVMLMCLGKSRTY